MKKSTLGKVGLWVFGIIFLLPIFLYITQFGIGLWDEHTKWAELGSFFSGIYSPIIALLALCILVAQSFSQVQMNKHQYDQNFIQGRLKDLDFYLSRLEKSLESEAIENVKVSEIVVNNFKKLSMEQLSNPDIQEMANKFCVKQRITFELWLSIMGILTSLNAIDETPYEDAFTSAKFRLSTILSWQVCVSLDKLYAIRNNEKTTKKLFFWSE